jgi:hypothetical protein
MRFFLGVDQWNYKQFKYVLECEWIAILFLLFVFIVVVADCGRRKSSGGSYLFSGFVFAE